MPLMDPRISTPEPPPTHRKSRRNGWRWVGLIAGVVLLSMLLAVVDVRTLLREALSWIERLGAWGPVLFIAAYVLATVLFLPGSVLTLGAGALFGVAWGSVYVSIGSTLGATCAFLVGRYLARDWVAAKIRGNERFSAMDRAVADEGWRIVGLTRLSPVFPFALLNYAFGITQVSLKGYVLASWIGMMPATVMYVYLGSLARAGAAGRQRTTAEWTLYGVGLLATLAVTVMMTRMARRALAKRTQSVA
jgi:uncharacterized membrane protein YdjX (TVP38/TMEM64 family)